MIAAQSRTRVAILGGGVSALTAALELSDPAQKDAFDITIYQMGWRLGGKCASGRNADNNCAIQEHGLHVFFGFYDNAFQVLRQCYDTLDRDPASRFPTLFDALARNDSMTLLEQVDGQWRSWKIDCPPLPGLPGDGDPPGVWTVVTSALEWLAGCHGALHAASATGLAPVAAHKPGWWERLFGHGFAPRTDEYASQGGFSLDAARHAARALPDAPEQHQMEQHVRIADLIAAAWAEMRGWFPDPASWRGDLRHMLIEADLIWANLVGILRDGLLIHPHSATARMNERDYRDWLGLHGAHTETLDSAPVRALYDLIFAYPEGDIGRPGNAEAGSMVNALLQLWRYRGAVTWKMRAGTGDVVIAPMYEVLRKRGVKVEFFARVSDLVPDPAGTRIDRVVIQRQVNLKAEPYDPLIRCDGLDCWPDRPKYDAIVEGPDLEAAGIDLESRWSGWADRGGEQKLLAGRDFDVLVLGISKEGLGDICSGLIAQKPAWQDMMAAVRTVETQSVQLHLDRGLAQMGWGGPAGSLAGAFDASALDTWAEISEILPQEGWSGPDAPVAAVILCGPKVGPALPPAPSDADYPRRAIGQVTDTTLDFLTRRSTAIWPGLNGPSGFDWAALHDASARTGPDRLDAQYLRANIDPSERYVQSFAGTGKHRLRTDRSGYANLYLTGDWIDNPQNLGSFEASVMAGKLASRAISGHPKAILRLAADSPYLDQRPPVPPRGRFTAPYMVHGGVQTFSGPITFENTTMWAFVVPADLAKLTALCGRIFNDPTGGAHDYVPLTNRVLMSVTEIPRGRFRSYPGMGYAQERELAVWMFLGKRKYSGSPIIERVDAFCPYLFLDNPIARSTGREVFGYMKQMGWISHSQPQAGRHLLSIDAYGTPVGGDDALWDRNLFVTLEQIAAPAGAVESAIDSVEAAAQIVSQGLTRGGDWIVPGLNLVEQAVEALRTGTITQMFLKQYRDIEDTTMACYQAIAEAPARITRIEGVHFASNFQFTRHNLVNIPMCEELGIPETCQTELAMKLELDMTVDPGRVVWEA